MVFGQKFVFALIINISSIEFSSMCADPLHSNSSGIIIGLRAIFKGRVQGVGFRYRTSRIARRYPLSGFVQNLPDGTVELVVQAVDKSVLEEFFDEMMLAFAVNVTDVSIQDVVPDPACLDFSIKR